MGGQVKERPSENIGGPFARTSTTKVQLLDHLESRKWSVCTLPRLPIVSSKLSLLFSNVPRRTTSAHLHIGYFVILSYLDAARSFRVAKIVFKLSFELASGIS